MANAQFHDGLQVCLSPEQWKQEPAARREELTYQLLCYLVHEAQRSKFTDRCMTFAGSFLANLIILVPTILIIIEKIGNK